MIFILSADFIFRELLHVQKELSTALGEIKTLQEKLGTESAAWNTEKTEMQVNLCV